MTGLILCIRRYYMYALTLGGKTSWTLTYIFIPISGCSLKNYYKNTAADAAKATVAGCTILKQSFLVSHSSKSIHTKFTCKCFIYNRGAHITNSFFGSLQWLPVSFIIDFKILLLVCKSLNSSVPQDVWCAFKIQYVAPRSLRSSDCLLAAPWGSDSRQCCLQPLRPQPLKQPAGGPEDVRECILNVLPVLLL